MTWRNLDVAPSASHHLRDGEPAYADRFDEVLRFHAPGLAPVRRSGEAWHIHADGRPAYERRFQRTFGFYEGLAAVAGDDGWRHIDPTGADVYPQRFSWCGNFQGGRCAVRAHNGRYHHIGSTGEPAYDNRWRYAGDFRDGVAVVQAEDGRSTHIDLAGRLIHGRWFMDLDVFHKAFARARDEAGWMHVDTSGKPIYARRFAAVEPFYNGQARVERLDGGLEVIDESGCPLVELRASTTDALHSVSADLVSFWRCETIFAAVDLGLFDRLPLGDSDIDDRTRRLTAALSEMGLVEQIEGSWSVSERGALLREDHPRSLVATARYWAGDGRRGWNHLRSAISDPTWQAPNPFADVSTDPIRVRAFHAALSPYAEHDYAALPAAIDPGHCTVLDAGGSTGALACTLLRARSELTAVVLDRPEVVELASPPIDLSGRLAFVAGDLFAPWPLGADAVILARILHDWDDEQCVQILRHARDATQPGGRIYVVEKIRSPGHSGGALLSLHLLVSTGGRERTRDEFERLFVRAGLRLREVRKIRSISSVLVAERE